MEAVLTEENRKVDLTYDLSSRQHLNGSKPLSLVDDYCVQEVRELRQTS